MADSPQAALGEVHRAEQDRLAQALATLVLTTWRTGIVPGIPSDTMAEAWFRDIAPLILAFRERSEILALGFYEQQRLLAGIDDPFLPGQADPLDEDVVRTSLKVVGIIGLTEKIVAGMEVSAAFAEAGDAAAGAAIRHALNGGRSFTTNTVAQDAQALGFYRELGPTPCWFCAMLASRTNYKADSFERSDARFVGTDSEWKVHDNCHCTLVPIYSRTTPLPSANRAATELWEKVGQPHSGDPAAARLAFRQAYEGRAQS